MSKELLSDRDYQYSGQGYLVDNGPWQEEIRRRLKEELRKTVTDPHPTLDTDEFRPFMLPENPEAAEVSEPVKEPEPTAEELVEKARADAEEKARSIEQAARKSAYEILEQARWEADDLATKAREESEKEIQALKDAASEEGRKLGFEKGLEEGLQKGRAEGAQSYSEAIQKWDGLQGETLEERKRLLGEMQPLLVELVGEALHRCLKRIAETDRQVAVETVKEVLRKAQDRVHLKLHLNPKDSSEIESRRQELQLSVGVGALEIIPDGRVEPGGCVLETEAGSVDGRLSTVASQVKESLGRGAD
jgi:flagellar assembly protein FliH